VLTERPSVTATAGTSVPATPGWYAPTYGLVMALTILSRLWDLGTRAMHHDESLHAYFSWLLANGGGYVHDPMMHGPVLFHLVAAAYYLLGDNEVVSRLWPALLGIGLVAAPHFLRPWIGHRGAVAAAILLCLSPLTTYFSRFIRHDVLAEAWFLVGLIALMEYMRRRSRSAAVAFGLGMGLLFSEKEVSYIYALCLLPFIATVQLLPRAPWTAATIAATLLLPAAILMLGPGPLGLGPLPAVPYPLSSFAQAMEITQQFLDSPLVRALAATFLVSTGFFAAALIWELKRQTIRVPWADLGWATLAFCGTFVLFHTTFFQNPLGLFTGSFGAVAYWLSQHAVRRGDQPWFYYLVLIPIYEPLTIAMTLTAMGSVTSAVLRIRDWLKSPWQSSLTFGPMAAFWLVASAAIYSWAGEKMPWLSVHILLPAILLAAWGSEHSWSFLKGHRALWVAGLAPAVLLSTYQAHSLVQLSFYNGDVPTEMAVYTQTTPEVARLARVLDMLSQYRYGDYRLRVAIDADTAWPFQWYLRRYQNLAYLGTEPKGLPEKTEVALLGLRPEPPEIQTYRVVRMPLRWWFPEESYRRLTHGGDAIIEAKELVQTVVSDLWTPARRIDFLKYLLWRQSAPLGSTDFYLAVRADLWPDFMQAWRATGQQ
jgi:uncharacterized protein (TIGR03663 family)